MGGPDERERIEIELVSTDQPPSAFSRSAPSDALVEARRAEPLTSNSRVVVVSAVVAVCALALGWGLGRAGGDTTQVRPPATQGPDTERSDPVQSIATVPTSSAPRPTTTVAAVGVAGDEPTPSLAASTVESSVDVAAPLRGQSIEIVAFGNGRQLFQLDLTTSTLLATEVAVQPFGRTRLLVAPDWALLPSNEAVLASTVVRPDGSVEVVELGASWQVVGLADSGSVWWVAPPAEGGSEFMIQRRTIRGEWSEEIAALPSFPIGVDPAGGVIVELPGQVSGVHPQTAVTVADTGESRPAVPDVDLITTGRVVALSAEIAVVEECGDDLDCGVFVVDRATGGRRELPTTGEPAGGLAPYGMAAVPSVAPGGQKAAVRVLEPSGTSSSQATLGVMDLATGAVVEIGPTQDLGQVVWTPDGRFLLHIDGGRIAAFDTETASAVLVIDELVAISSFGVRPVDG